MALVRKLCGVVLVALSMAMGAGYGYGTQPVLEPGFVTAVGTHFELNGQPFYFQGTNVSYFGTTDKPAAEIYRAMAELSARGIRVVRFWGFTCAGAFGGGEPMIQKVDANGAHTNEAALARLDATFDAARLARLKVILTLVNYEPEYCGMDWWVYHLTGQNDKQLFYSDQRVVSAFKNHVANLLGRVNSVYRQSLGRAIAYKDDPTIMAIEVANEPHTQDEYERNRGLAPGGLVYAWLKDLTAFVRHHDQKHLITTGEEGYKATVDPVLDTWNHAWINNGFKGVDFERNVQLPDVDFATVHIYPDNWDIRAEEMDWVGRHIVRRRADIAHGAMKPIVLEEAGFSADQSWHPHLGFAGEPARWLRQLYGHANDAGFAGTMIWQFFPPGFGKGGYNYDFTDPVADVVVEQARAMAAKGAASSH